MEIKGGFLISKIKYLNDRVFEKVLAEEGIEAFNGTQGRILYILWDKNEVPIKTISKESGLAITSLTTILENMEKDGLIIRAKDETDKRQTMISLTKKARNLSKNFDNVSKKMNKIFYKYFDKEQIIMMEEWLKKICDSFEDANSKMLNS